ncbi:uncharacterized protein AFUA_3G01550 [Aspergillus fumigatus Af293]|jgi:hypothetical protein
MLANKPTLDPLKPPLVRSRRLPRGTLRLDACGIQIRLEGIHKLRPEDNLMAQIQHGKQDRTDIRDEEIRDIKRGDPRREPLREDDQDIKEKPVVGEPRLPDGLVRQGIAGDIARGQHAHERNVAGVDGRPADEPRHAGDVDQPVEDLAAGLGEVEEAEEPERGGEGHADVGHAALRDFGEPLRGEALARETEEHTAAAVDVGVGGGEDDGEEHGVDQAGEDLDAGEVGGDDHRGRGGVGGVRDQVGVVVGDQQPDEEDGQDEEDENAEEGLADGGGDRLLGVLGLSGGDTHELGALVGEAGLDQDGPESYEFGGIDIGLDEVRCKRAGVLPRVESQVALLTDAGIDADGEDHETKHSKHLDGREPELELSVEADGQEVDQRDEHPEHPDEDSNRQVLVPVLDDHPGGRQFHRVCRSPVEPVDPSHGKSQTGIDQSCCIRGEGARGGDVRRNFSQRGHHRVDDRPDKDVCDQSPDWTSVRDGRSTADKQTGSNCSSCRLLDFFFLLFPLLRKRSDTDRWQSSASVYPSTAASDRASPTPVPPHCSPHRCDGRLAASLPCSSETEPCLLISDAFQRWIPPDPWHLRSDCLEQP